MKLNRLTVAQKYEIKEPIWYGPYDDKPRCVGIDVEFIKDHNDIEILYTNKKGERLWDGHFYFPGSLKMFFKTQERWGRTLLIIPIYSLTKLERV